MGFRKQVLLSTAAVVSSQANAGAVAATSAHATAESAQAQNVPAEQASSAVRPVDATDIIVTAQRRRERLLDVPASIVVTTGEKLERLHLNAASDLQYVTPGLALGDSNTSRGQGLRIRGIGTTVFADGIEQSVGTVVDGIPLARAGQGLADLVDLDRVEVLRGPQGLLFGRNASAGLINIVTRRPTRVPSLIANASYASGDEVNLSAGLSGPVAGDKILARVSGYFNKRRGFVTDVFDGRLLNNRNEYGFRGTVEFHPADGLEILLRGDWSRRANDCCIWTVRQFATAATDPRPGQRFLSAFTGPIATGPRARQIAGNGEYRNLVTSRGVSGEANFAIGDYTLTSLTGYRRWNQADNNDADLSPSNVLNRNFGSNALNQFSQEFRLTSPSARPFRFVGGLFYYNSNNRGQFQQIGRFSLSLANLQNLGINAPLAPGVILPAAQLFGRDVTTKIAVSDYAAFGQGDWKVGGGVSLTAGARLTKTRVGLDYTRVGTPGANAFNFVVGRAFAPLAFNAKTRDTNISWRLGVQYVPQANHMLYASVSRGYKGPGFNNLLDIVVPAGSTPQAFTKVDPEIPTAYELGYKASLLDRKLSLSAALYLTDFKDFQAQIVEFAPGASIGSFAIRNAGKLRSKGLELTLEARPTRHFTAGVSFAFNDAKYVSFTGASCPRLGALVTTVGAPCGPAIAGGPKRTSFDASGLGVTNAPKYTAALDARWDTPLSGNLNGFVQANYYWRSATKYGLYPDNIANPTIQPSYGILNGSVGVDVDRKITVSIFAKNLFDQNFVTSIFDLPLDSAGGLGQYVTRDAERTLGVQANLRF